MLSTFLLGLAFPALFALSGVKAHDVCFSSYHRTGTTSATHVNGDGKTLTAAVENQTPFFVPCGTDWAMYRETMTVIIPECNETQVRDEPRFTSGEITPTPTCLFPSTTRIVSPSFVTIINPGSTTVLPVPPTSTRSQPSIHTNPSFWVAQPAPTTTFVTATVTVTEKHQPHTLTHTSTVTKTLSPVTLTTTLLRESCTATATLIHEVCESTKTAVVTNTVVDSMCEPKTRLVTATMRDVETVTLQEKPVTVALSTVTISVPGPCETWGYD
ncbi:hypothetical protein AMATHDRAFT_50262 [Amanita thiersii Skay4041]|uniref:Uncharacterized protein n=1 Tax=Amanita thiersii Skay4041 TaxID=703135 RepID=A0A2A9NIH1_9AGAR|nr:hypothetical protein AMATHDRAFT_50262 [Amanita thiersii Skay4041]